VKQQKRLEGNKMELGEGAMNPNNQKTVNSKQ